MLSHVRLFATPWTAAYQASLSITNSWSWWCTLSWWCHPIRPSFVIPFSPCLQSFPASGSSPVSQFFASGGQSIGLQLQHQPFQWIFQDWFPLGLTGWIFLQSRGLSKSLLQQHSPKTLVLQHSAFFMVQLSHPYMTSGKTSLTRCTFVGKVMSLLFNKLSRLVIAFLPRSKCLSISWLQSPSVGFWGPWK